MCEDFLLTAFSLEMLPNQKPLLCILVERILSTISRGKHMKQLFELPQALLMHNCTVPLSGELPPTSLRSPVVQSDSRVDRAVIQQRMRYNSIKLIYHLNSYHTTTMHDPHYSVQYESCSMFCSL